MPPHRVFVQFRVEFPAEGFDQGRAYRAWSRAVGPEAGEGCDWSVSPVTVWIDLEDLDLEDESLPIAWIGEHRVVVASGEVPVLGFGPEPDWILCHVAFAGDGSVVEAEDIETFAIKLAAALAWRARDLAVGLS